MKHILEQEIKQFLKEIRPPIEIRSKLDIGYSFIENSLEIFEIRPRWDDPSIIMNSSVAKTKFIKSKNIWKIYWKRANGKWVIYDPKPEVKTLSEFFKILKKDEYCVFWG
jgi:hypothetical protein